MTVDLKRFVDDRDEKLCEWFAEGNPDSDVLALCQANGYDLSLDGVKDKRRELYQKTIRVIAAKGSQNLSKVPRAQKSVRVMEMDRTCDQLQEAILWCMDNEKYSLLPKLADCLLRAQRGIAEEVHDIEPATRGMNVYLTMIQDAPPEKRSAMLGQMRAFRELMDVEGQLALGNGDGS